MYGFVETVCSSVLISALVLIFQFIILVPHDSPRRLLIIAA